MEIWRMEKAWSSEFSQALWKKIIEKAWKYEGFRVLERKVEKKEMHLVKYEKNVEK